jgi:hypothetical protein
MLPKEVHIYSRMVIEALQMAQGYESTQVSIPLFIHYQEDEMVGIQNPLTRGVTIFSIPGRYIGFAPEDGFNSCFGGLTE